MQFRNPLPYAAQKARGLRKQLTKAEVILWDAVRDRRFYGLKFRRQVPVGRFIVDFMCTRPRYIIELDGQIHQSQRKKDAERSEAILYDENIPVLRFTNEEIVHDLPQVLEAMKKVLLPASKPV